MSEMMNMFVLAVVQGLTEFLPVSSSGHLALGKYLLGFEALDGFGVELLLHLGTLAAVFAYYWGFIVKTVKGLLAKEKEAWHFAICVLISMIPAVVVGLLWEERLEQVATYPRAVAGLLMVTGCMLIGTRLFGRERELEITPKSAFLIGCAQAFAMLPGISRSGSTISMARFIGIAQDKIARFSFLMVVPVILGGNLLHIVKALGGSGESAFEGLTWGLAVMGLATSAVVGYLSVAWMVRLLSKQRFWLFGIYCLTVGVFFFFFA